MIRKWETNNRENDKKLHVLKKGIDDSITEKTQKIRLQFNIDKSKQEQ